MTRENDQNQPEESQPEQDELQRRLGQTKAELTGHVPVPEPRLDAMFVSGTAPGDWRPDMPAAGVPAEAVTPIESVTSFESGAARRRRAAITAIAAAFVLLVGLVAFGANRGDSDSPVEVAGDTADAPQRPLANETPSDGDPGAEGGNAGSEAGDDSDGSGHDGGDAGDSDLEGGDEHPDGDIDGHDGLPGFFDGDLREHLESLWAENAGWIDCVTDAIDAWVESWPGDENGPHGPDIDGLCGEPSLEGLGDGFVWPDLSIPDGDFPEFDIPDLDEEFCEKVETQAGASITCRWPQCPTDSDASGPSVWPICDWPPCPPDAGADGPAVWPICDWPPCDILDETRGASGLSIACRWPPCEATDNNELDNNELDNNELSVVCPPFAGLPPLEELLPEEFEFDFQLPFDEGDLSDKLDELLPEQWRDHLDELEDGFRDLEKHFDDLAESFGSPGAGGGGHGSGSNEA